MLTDATIEKLVFGGLGLARTEFGVILVPDTLPGERVQVVYEDEKNGCRIGRLVTVLEKSPLRRVPSCQFAGICGGCDLLHCSYSGQIACKKEIFIECLTRIARLKSVPEPDVFESPEHAYRIRAQIKVDQRGDAGFFRKKSNEIVSIKTCPLLSDPLNELLRRGAVGTLSPVRTINLRLFAGDSGVASNPLIPMFTRNSAFITVGNRLFEVSGESFFQSNGFLLQSLGTWALPYVGGDFCVDLYGGSGFFSVMLADAFSRGLLVELLHNQVVQARKNFAENGIGHFKATTAPVEQIGGLIRTEPDLLIIDPPRPGLTKAAREIIARCGAKTILYVSCNASTQARDAGFFVHKAGYSITNAALFDLYPNTHHLETVLLFRRLG